MGFSAGREEDWEEEEEEGKRLWRGRRGEREKEQENQLEGG